MLTNEVNTLTDCELGSISPLSPRLMKAWSYLCLNSIFFINVEG
jgi:hypothetical protein